MNADLNHGLDDCDPIVFPRSVRQFSCIHTPVPLVSELFGSAQEGLHLSSALN